MRIILTCIHHYTYRACADAGWVHTDQTLMLHTPCSVSLSVVVSLSFSLARRSPLCSVLLSQSVSQSVSRQPFTSPLPSPSPSNRPFSHHPPLIPIHNPPPPPGRVHLLPKCKTPLSHPSIHPFLGSNSSRDRGDKRSRTYIHTYITQQYTYSHYICLLAACRECERDPPPNTQIHCKAKRHNEGKKKPPPPPVQGSLHANCGPASQPASQQREEHNTTP